MEDIVRRFVREELAAAFGASSPRFERQVIEANPQRQSSVSALAMLLDASTDE